MESERKKRVCIALACFTNLHAEIVNQMLRTRPLPTAILKTAQYSTKAKTATSCCCNFTWVSLCPNFMIFIITRAIFLRILHVVKADKVFLIQKKNVQVALSLITSMQFHNPTSLLIILRVVPFTSVSFRDLHHSQNNRLC